MQWKTKIYAAPDTAKSVSDLNVASVAHPNANELAANMRKKEAWSHDTLNYVCWGWLVANADHANTASPTDLESRCMFSFFFLSLLQKLANVLAISMWKKAKSYDTLLYLGLLQTADSRNHANAKTMLTVKWCHSLRSWARLILSENDWSYIFRWSRRQCEDNEQICHSVCNHV